MIELGAVLQIERDGEKIRAAFPTRENEEEISARSHREKAYKEQRRHYLYVISNGGKVKIGISGQLEQRLTALRVSFPLEIEVLLTVSGPYRAIRRAEMDAHEALKDCALGGEYFDSSHGRALEVTRAALVRHGVNLIKRKVVEAIP